MPQKLNHRLPGIPSTPSTRMHDPCLPWRALLPEAAEDLLDPIALLSLEQHLAGCAACRAELEDAHRGLAWLTMLKDDAPAAPDALLASILAQTTGAQETGVFLPEQPAYVVETEPVPSAWQTALSWMRGEPGTWSSLLQPHFAMTGAMAFLSLCVTINLLNDSLSLHNTTPSGLEHTVANTEASVIRSLHGLRVIYRVESRVQELRTEVGHAAARDGSR